LEGPGFDRLKLIAYVIPLLKTTSKHWETSVLSVQNGTPPHHATRQTDGLNLNFTDINGPVLTPHLLSRRWQSNYFLSVPDHELFAGFHSCFG